VQEQHEYMFWQYGVRAVRSGKWKGIGKGGHLYLYDLSKDIEEKNDLSSRHPEIAARMKKYITIGYREPRSQKDDGKYTGKDKK
jgi:arylsulfatase A-like enzyme